MKIYLPLLLAGAMLSGCDSESDSRYTPEELKAFEIQNKEISEYRYNKCHESLRLMGDKIKNLTAPMRDNICKCASDVDAEGYALLDKMKNCMIKLYGKNKIPSKEAADLLKTIPECNSVISGVKCGVVSQ